MVSRFLVLFLFISNAQTISNADFHTFFTSENRGLNHSSGQLQEFLERLYGNMKDKTRLDEKFEQRKNELSDTLRKARGGGTAGSFGGANINRHPHPTRSSANSLLEVPFFASQLQLFLH